MELWFTEKYGNVAGLTIRISKHLHSEVTPFQIIDVFETPGFGRILTLDGLIMVTEKDEFVYHEALVHPAMVYAEKVDSVLVVGGGDGGSTREILKYGVSRVDVVEIDERVIEVSREFFSNLASSFDSPLVNVINEDITKFVKNCKRKYDVIILDTSDPVGPAQGLYTEEFYNSLKDCLSNGGIIAIQSESPWWQDRTIKDLSRILKLVFGRIRYYVAPVLSYPGGLWLFSLIGGDDKIKRDLPENLKFVDKFFVDNLHIPPFIMELTE